MDKFFTQKKCDRCGTSLAQGRIMSMLNTDCICLKCKEKEKQDPLYKKAVETELEEVKKGNYNYEGLKQGKQLSDKLIEQILNIRASGKVNMFDLSGVQREAFEHRYHELVIFMEDNKPAYLDFILCGKK